MQVKPLNGRVLVKPLAKEQETKSGILLPETASAEKPEKAEVVAVGEGRTLENGTRVAMSVKVGDVVLLKRGYGTIELKLDGAELLMLEESEILAIVA